MNILHERVEHNQFGNGEIVDQSDSVITVHFLSNNEEKKFLYPQAFDHHLTLENANLMPELESELNIFREQMLKEQKKLEAARLAERLAYERISAADRAKRQTKTRVKVQAK